MALLPRPDTTVAWSYGQLLRAVGAMLDADHAGRISIVEVDDGFVLRRQRFRHTTVDLAVSHVTRDALHQHALQLRQARPRARSVRRPGLWSSFPHTHQDFFRCLGHELDVVGARHLVVDELSDGLLLCYQQAAHEGYLPGMRRVVLSPSDIEQILNEATRRRRRTDQNRVPQELGAGGREIGAKPVQQGAAVWAPVQDNVPYQQFLRAVGAALDERGAERVCLLEAPDGLTVRYQVVGDARLRWTRFTNEQLDADGLRLRQGLGLRRRKKLTMPARYQDLFRVLGYELEREHASGIMVGEQEDGFTVTYQYVDPRRSLTAMKAMVFLGQREQDALRQSAQARRRSNGHLLARLTRRQRSHPPGTATSGRTQPRRPGDDAGGRGSPAAPRVALWDTLKQGTT